MEPVSVFIIVCTWGGGVLCGFFLARKILTAEAQRDGYEVGFAEGMLYTPPGPMGSTRPERRS